MSRIIERITASLESTVSHETAEEIVCACQDLPKPTTPARQRKYLAGLMASLDVRLDAATRQRVMQNCGQQCIGAGIITRAAAIYKASNDLDELLDQLNKMHVGGGSLRREGNLIYGYYDRCYCGLVSQAKGKISPSYCLCSCGWYKALFEGALGKPVEVKLLQSLLGGASRCAFEIRIGDSKDAKL
jgi:hypothetical protein